MFKKSHQDIKNPKKDSKGYGTSHKNHKTLTRDSNQNMAFLKKSIGISSDIIFREFSILKKPIHMFICYVDGLVDKELVRDNIDKILSINIHLTRYNEQVLSDDIFSIIRDNILNTPEVKEQKSLHNIMIDILSGHVALIIDGYDKSLIMDMKGWEKRSITEPETEIAIRGPREGFNETLRVNTSMLRRKIINPNFIIEEYIIGKETNTNICIAYIDGIADKKNILELKKRLDQIDSDVILESGYIEQYISSHHPLTPFHTVGNSEKPDKVAAKILEGRIAILCNGTPFVLTIPYVFIENFQLSEDYYLKPFLGTFERIIRYTAFLITLLLPALYIALETYHQEMLPPILLITMASAREGIPFPAFTETLIMITSFEILRESGLRMPRQVGQAVSIVGALVIGESAVSAGLIGAPMVIVTALTGITSFIVPSLINSIIFFRYLLIIASGTFGLYGITIILIIMLAYMCSLDSFGTPYLSPFAPVKWKDLKDALIVVPHKYGQLKSKLNQSNQK